MNKISVNVMDICNHLNHILLAKIIKFRLSLIASNYRFIDDSVYVYTAFACKVHVYIYTLISKTEYITKQRKRKGKIFSRSRLPYSTIYSLSCHVLLPQFASRSLSLYQHPALPLNEPYPFH